MDGRLRPRFERFSRIELENFRDRLQTAVRRSDGRLVGEVLNRHAQIMIGGPERHLWSPCLWLSYAPVDGEAGLVSRVRGHFGPRPAVWTFFAIVHLIAACVAFFGALFGWAQWLLDDSPSGFYAVGGAVLLSAILYTVSLSGKSMADAEMHELAGHIDRALSDGDESSSGHLKIGNSQIDTSRVGPEAELSSGVSSNAGRRT